VGSKLSQSEVELSQINIEEGLEMPYLICPKCQGESRVHATHMKFDCDSETKIWGIIQCLGCGHQMPITLNKGCIESVDVSLPATQSDHLISSVPDGIKDDIQEAERCNYYQCYKASVTMCRRALQLGLIDKGIPDGPLSGMLSQAKGSLLSQEIYDLATSIKGYGDIGAHRRERLEPQEVSMVIYAAVRMLNELFSTRP
jgi:hypothetical protein